MQTSIEQQYLTQCWLPRPSLEPGSDPSLLGSCRARWMVITSRCFLEDCLSWKNRSCELLSVFASNKSLIHLNLRANFVEDYGMKFLCEALSHSDYKMQTTVQTVFCSFPSILHLVCRDSGYG